MEFNIKLKEGAAENFRNCQTLIDEMKRKYIGSSTMQEKYVDPMERSFWNCVSSLMLIHTEYDGDIEIWPEEGYSFFWRHAKSGLHGGMIFHHAYSVGVPEEDARKIGTWSIHT